MSSSESTQKRRIPKEVEDIIGYFEADYGDVGEQIHALRDAVMLLAMRLDRLERARDDH